LRAGHMWVFSNEVDTGKTPLKGLEPGEVVNLVDSAGKAVGSAMVNPGSLISARIFSRRPDTSLSENWLARRLEQAVGLRQSIHDKPYYRAIFAEADGLPGLILDRFDDVLVGQLNTAGMDRVRGELEKAIVRVLAPSALLWRNDSGVRELEGLGRMIETGFGTVPGHLKVIEQGLEFSIDPVAGQKTGWYFDQAANRARVRPLIGQGDDVLDLYCYHGAWGLMAASSGAGQVTCIDASEAAVDRVRINARANGLESRVQARVADVEAWLEQCIAERRRFDTVIVDPPALVKKARDVKPGLAKYRRINELALRVVNYGGLLATCSCSAHVREDVFADILRKAARHVDREIQILMRLEQGPDHPVAPAIPETRYLKGLVVRVLPSY